MLKKYTSAFFYHQNIVLCIAKLNGLNLYSSPIVLGGYRPEGPQASNFVDSKGNSYRSLAAGFKEKAITDLISSPTLSRSEILKKLTSIFDGEVNELVNNLLGALAENDRLEICPEISNLYESLLAEHNQQLDIDVSIPVDLGDETKEGLKQSILKKYGETSNIYFLVDPAIMGGITIKIDDEILDLSIKGRVQKLVNELNI